jgi:hypothetical protein
MRLDTARLGGPPRPDPTQEDHDFFGVNISVAPNGDGVVVESRFGDEAGLLRVVARVEREAEVNDDG